MKKINIYLTIKCLLLALLSYSGTCLAQSDSTLNEYVNTITAHDSAKVSRKIIVIIDTTSHTRAFEPFGGNIDNGVKYAEAINLYKSELGENVNVYSMVIPTAVEYYCPDMAKKWTKEERYAIDKINENLSDSVKVINVYNTLANHVSEDIYSRTDHHWAPLGAFYAAEKFAEVADVPFKALSEYEPRVVKDYVGTMYLFSKDMSVKNSPEEFVYYVPKNIDYKATYIKYRLGKKRNVIGESAPEEDEFFIYYKDGSSGAYCTFMGGDTRTVTVKTGTKNGRKLLIMKDSFGNALPGYLFYSFEEIHVLDFRYFRTNVVSYAKEHGITDMLFANNVLHATLESTSDAYLRLAKTGKKPVR